MGKRRPSGCDPNWFGGDLLIAGENEEWRTIRTDDKTFGAKNWPKVEPKFANDRGLGLAEMARAIIERRPHRASGDVALHVLAVMTGISKRRLQAGGWRSPRLASGRRRSVKRTQGCC